jgi:hypothetical protein
MQFVKLQNILSSSTIFPTTVEEGNNTPTLVESCSIITTPVILFTIIIGKRARNSQEGSSSSAESGPTSLLPKLNLILSVLSVTTLISKDLIQDQVPPKISTRGVT